MTQTSTYTAVEMEEIEEIIVSEFSNYAKAIHTEICVSSWESFAGTTSLGNHEVIQKIDEATRNYLDCRDSGWILNYVTDDLETLDLVIEKGENGFCVNHSRIEDKAANYVSDDTGPSSANSEAFEEWIASLDSSL